MGDNTAHNNKAIDLAFQKRFIPTLERTVIFPIMKTVANAVYEWIDSQSFYEDDTFNLRDGTGVGLYKNGELLNLVPPPSAKATGTNTIYWQGNKITIDGRALLDSALTSIVNVWGGTGGQRYDIIVFNLVPYGYFVEHSLGSGGSNKRGKGWWSDGLKVETLRTVVQAIINAKKS